MGYLSRFFIESKHFELSASDGSFVLCIVKRSKGVSWVVVLGKVSVEWLLGSLEALLSGEGKDEFVNLPKLGAELI
jgi:hypothetical protein